MKRIIACLVISPLLACADHEQVPPSQDHGPAAVEMPGLVDTVQPDTLLPDTVMARDTARSPTES